ncbi:MAG: hypothetical protein RL676_254, partial [Pseudomonadota bacterium]
LQKFIRACHGNDTLGFFQGRADVERFGHAGRPHAIQNPLRILHESWVIEVAVRINEVWGHRRVRSVLGNQCPAVAIKNRLVKKLGIHWMFRDAADFLQF